MKHQRRNKAVNGLNISITKRVLIANAVLQFSVIASKSLSTMLVCSNIRVHHSGVRQMENHVRDGVKTILAGQLKFGDTNRLGWKFCLYAELNSWILHHPNYYKLLSFSHSMKVHAYNTNQQSNPGVVIPWNPHHFSIAHYQV
jgi:hypothetical protein